MKPKRRRGSRGFTLLEIMIAMTIMAVAFGAILTSQSGSLVTATRSKDLNTAGLLAHDLMVKSEHLMEGKPFGELKEVEMGEFEEEQFKRFKWKREVKELKFPDFSAPVKEGEAVPQVVTLMGKTVSKYLSDAMRELVITITWQQGKEDRQIAVSTYLVDLNAEYTFSEQQ